MFKTILVPLRGDDGDKPSLGTALAVASLFGGHIEVAHMQSRPRMLATAIGANPAQIVSGLPSASALREYDEDSSRRARQQYEKFCSAAKIRQTGTPHTRKAVSAAWVDQDGDTVEQVVRLGRRCDVVVLHAGLPGNGGFAPKEAGEIILSRGGPVILAPSRPPAKIARKIAIAWKDTPEISATLSAAMPLLYQAAKIFVVSVSEQDAPADPSVDDIVQRLRWHDLDAAADRIKTRGSSPAVSLIKHVEKLGADLLVMGAYGRNRMHEFVFGSFTNQVLLGASVPVFLSH